MSTPDSGASPSLTRRALHGVLWLGILNSSASLLVVGLNAYLNRSLPGGPSEMGLWLFVLKLLLFTNLVFEGGLTAVLKQRKSLDPGQVTAIGRIQAALGLGGALLLFGCAGWIAPLFPALPTEQLESLLRLCSPAVLVVALGFTQKSLIERELDFRKVATIESCSTVLFVILGVWLASTKGAAGLVYATIARHSLETLLYWTLGPLTKQVILGRALWTGIGEQLRFGGAILGQSVLGNVMRHADVLIAGILLTGAGLSVYAQLQLFIALPLSKITMYAARVAFPTFAHVQDQPERLKAGLERMQRLVALTVFPALAGLVAVGPRLFRLYLGPDYSEWMTDAWRGLLVLAIGAGAYTYSFSVAVVLNAIGDAAALLKRQALGALIVVTGVAAAGLAGFLPMAMGRSVAITIAGLLFLALGSSRLGFGAKAIGQSVFTPLRASLGMGLIVTGLGLIASGLLPASDPFHPREAENLAMAGVLAVQVLAGIAVYLGLLRLLGVSALSEARALLARRRGVEAQPPER